MSLQIMQHCVQYLEDAAKVAAIQKFFGVSYIKRSTIKFSKKNEYTKEEGFPMVRRISSTNPPDFDVNSPDYSFIKDKSNYAETDTAANPLDKTEGKNYMIKYKFWYYIFMSLTSLGDVIGYALVLPFLFWNVDGVIGRKLVLVWTITMYVGQAVKEIFRRERPECPPVIRLQKRWSEEFGMPSTHAMAAVALPSSLLYYGFQRYRFRLELGIIVSLLWCLLISFSRLYLGMHSILDVIAGVSLALLLSIPLLPGMNFVGDLLAVNSWFPVVVIILSILLIFVYPKPRGLSPARSRTDTIIILASCVGVEIGCWMNYKLQFSQKSVLEPPYLVTIPDWKLMGVGTCRTILGLACIAVSFLVFNFLSKVTYWIINKTKISSADVSNSNRKIPIIDLCFEYLSFSITALHVTFSIPLLFRILNIERSSYFTE